MTRKQSKVKRGQSKRKENENVDKKEERLSDSFENGSSDSFAINSSKKFNLDFAHNAEQPSCSKCMGLLHRSWTWSALDKRQQTTFLSEVQSGNGKRRLIITEEELSKELGEIQCLADRTLVQDAMQRKQNTNSTSFEVIPGLRLHQKPNSSDMSLDNSLNIGVLDELVSLVNEAGRPSNKNSKNSHEMVGPSELFFPPPALFAEASMEVNSMNHPPSDERELFIADFLAAHETATREPKHAGAMHRWAYTEQVVKLMELLSSLEQTMVAAGSHQQSVDDAIKSEFELSQDQETNRRSLGNFFSGSWPGFMPGGAPDWNPKLGQLLQRADANLRQWSLDATSFLLLLRQFQRQSMLSSEADEKQCTELVEELWKHHEQVIDELSAHTNSARKELIGDEQGGNSSQTLALCWGAKGRATFARLVTEKFKLLSEFHRVIKASCETTPFPTTDLDAETAALAPFGVWEEHEQPTSNPPLPLFVRIGCFASVCETLNKKSHDWTSLEKIEEKALNYRIHILKDVGSGHGELLAVGREADSHLKYLLAEWERQLKLLQDSALERATLLLSPEMFPQSVGGMAAIAMWKEKFEQELDSLEQGHVLGARMAQQDVSTMQVKLGSLRGELKTLNKKESAANTVDKKKLKLQPDTPHQLEAVELNGLKVLNLDSDHESDEGSLVLVDPEVEERERQICRTRDILSLKQLDTCLKFRYFATRNMHMRQVLLQQFHARLDFWRCLTPHFTRRLCGGPQHALNKLRVTYARLLLEQIDTECREWVAREVEKQLVGDAEREDAKAKSRKKPKSTKKDQSEPIVEECGVSEQATESSTMESDTDAADEDLYHDASSTLPEELRSPTPEFLPPLNSETNEELSVVDGWHNIASSRKQRASGRKNMASNAVRRAARELSDVPIADLLLNTVAMDEVSLNAVAEEVSRQTMAVKEAQHNKESRKGGDASKRRSHKKATTRPSKLNVNAQVFNHPWNNVRSSSSSSDPSIEQSGDRTIQSSSRSSSLESEDEKTDMKVSDSREVPDIDLNKDIENGVKEEEQQVDRTGMAIINDIVEGKTVEKEEEGGEEESSEFLISFGSIPSKGSYSGSDDEVEINFGFGNSSSSEEEEEDSQLPPVSPPDKLPRQPKPIAQGKVIANITPSPEARNRPASAGAISPVPPVLPQRFRNTSADSSPKKKLNSPSRQKQIPIVGSAPVASITKSSKRNTVNESSSVKVEKRIPQITPELLPRTLGMGHNNCFMNVVVQSFWHLSSCREKITSMTVPSLSLRNAADDKEEEEEAEEGVEGGNDEMGDIERPKRISADLIEERELCMALQEVLIGLGKRPGFSGQLLPPETTTTKAVAVAVSETMSSKKRRKRKAKFTNAASSVTPTTKKGVVEVERLRGALVAVAAKEARSSKTNATDLATLGEMADAVDALGIVLHSLRKVMGDHLVDSLFTIRMREEYVCSHCATSVTSENAASSLKSEVLSNASTLDSAELLAQMTGRLSPKLDMDQIIEDKEMEDTEIGVVRIVAHDAPALSVAVPCLKHIASIRSGDYFDNILRIASEMSSDVIYCKRTASCRGRPLPCKRTLRSTTSSLTYNSRAPKVFTLELIHDNLRTRSDPVDIAQVLTIVQPQIDLNTVFAEKGVKLWADLRSLFCFHPHRHHYVVYCLDHFHRLWFKFDDDEVVPVGDSYNEVIAAASAGGFMPHVLFYEVGSGAH